MAIIPASTHNRAYILLIDDAKKEVAAWHVEIKDFTFLQNGGGYLEGDNATPGEPVPYEDAPPKPEVN